MTPSYPTNQTVVGEQFKGDLEGLEEQFQGYLGVSTRCSQEGPEEDFKGDLEGLEEEYKGDLDGLEKEFKGDLGISPRCSQEGLEEEIKSNLEGLGSLKAIQESAQDVRRRVWKRSLKAIWEV